MKFCQQKYLSALFFIILIQLSITSSREEAILTGTPYKQQTSTSQDYCGKVRYGCFTQGQWFGCCQGLRCSGVGIFGTCLKI